MAHTLPTQILTTCSKGLFMCFAEYMNTITMGAFWIFMLLGFQVTLFMATYRFGNARAFGFSSFVGLLGGIWLAVLGLLTWWVASAFIIVGLIGIAMMVLNEK